MTKKPQNENTIANVRLIELLYFAYRDFTHDVDQLLAEYKFGRAHHRILHFVLRNPGLNVTDLLDMLKITKQSLAPTLKVLLAQGYLTQQKGKTDRRQRALFLTEKGEILARELVACQQKRFERVFSKLDAGSDKKAFDFLLMLTDEEERKDIQQWISSNHL